VLTLELDNFDGVLLLAHPEDLEVAEDGFLRLGVTVDLDAEEVSLILPVKLALKVEVEGSTRRRRGKKIVKRSLDSRLRR
jgi:hypothetical protein